MSAEFLRIEEITKKFGNFTALENINITINEGEFICLLGPSGCGKTTLLRILAGLERPTTGKVYIRGVDVTGLHPSKRNYGIVFQSYALFPNMTVRQNIAFGLKNRKVSREETDQKVKAVLEQVNLLDQIDKYPAQLSGGQQQRIALARALVLSPDFLLLDEPLSALDAKVRQKLRKEIRSLQENLGITTIMVTHDQEEALTMADRIIVMNNACVVQEGNPIEVYKKPNTPFVADFIGSINFFRTDITKELEEAPKKTAQTELLRMNRYRIKACRPENIEIVDKNEEDSFKVKIKDIEFHGAAYRLILSLRSDTESMINNEYIYFDMQTEQFEKAGIQKGDKIYIHFSEGKLLYYNLDLGIKDENE